jgi:hypothetical protein
MQTQVIYFLDSVPGETVEEKAYGIIAEAYEESGFQPFDIDSESTEEPVSCADYVKKKLKFRIIAATRKGEEWTVVLEGEDDDIGEYQGILKECE